MVQGISSTGLFGGSFSQKYCSGIFFGYAPILDVGSLCSRQCSVRREPTYLFLTTRVCCNGWAGGSLDPVGRGSRDLTRKTVDAVRVLAEMGRINARQKGLLLADVIR